MTADPSTQIAEVVRAAAEVVKLDELGGPALAGLRDALSAAVVVVYRYGDFGEPAALTGPAGVFDGYRPELLASDPLQRAPRAMAPGVKVVFVTQSVDRGEFLRSDAYNQYYRQADLEHVACAWMTPGVRYGTPGMSGMLIGRARGQREFDARDRRLLETVLPSLCAAASRHRRVEKMERAFAVQDALLDRSAGRPLFAVDRHGRLLWASRRAERLLAGALGSRGDLPAELAAAARRLDALARTGELRDPPRLSVPLNLASGQHLALLSIVRTERGEPSVAVELEIASLPTLDSFARARGLTLTETAVLRLLCAGLSTRELAQRQCVGVETIRTHVRRVLAKLEMPSRMRAVLLVRQSTACNCM